MMVDHHGYLSVDCIDLRGGFLIGICWLDAFQCLYGTCSIKGAGAGGVGDFGPGFALLYCVRCGVRCGARTRIHSTVRRAVRCRVRLYAQQLSRPGLTLLCCVRCSAVNLGSKTCRTPPRTLHSAEHRTQHSRMSPGPEGLQYTVHKSLLFRLLSLSTARAADAILGLSSPRSDKNNRYLLYSRLDNFVARI